MIWLALCFCRDDSFVFSFSLAPPQWLRMAGRTRADPARLALLGPGEWSFWGSCSEAVYNAGLGCLAVHWLHLLVLGLTYYAPDSPLLLSRAWAWILVSMLAALCGFCALDARSLLDPSVESERRGLSTCRVLVMLVGCNVLLTGMACHDARLA